MNKLALVTVDGKLTLESTTQALTFSKIQMMELAKIPPLSIELEYYEQIRKDVTSESFKCVENTSRRFITQNNECISSIQILAGRKPNVMNVYMRSSSVAKLPSDVGFLARLALTYQVDELNILIGSLHIIL